MAMEYFIEELKGKDKVQHGSTFNFNEAQQKADAVRNSTGNPVNVEAVWIPENQIEDLTLPITAQEFYEEVHGKGARLDERDFRAKLIYQLLSESLNQILEKNNTEVIDGGFVVIGNAS